MRLANLNEHDQFWVIINGNFLDIAVLEWCKLFGDTRGKHYFGKVISDVPAFNTQSYLIDPTQLTRLPPDATLSSTAKTGAFGEDCLSA
jgi:hypothetical protein